MQVHHKETLNNLPELKGLVEWWDSHEERPTKQAFAEKIYYSKIDVKYNNAELYRMLIHRDEGSDKRIVINRPQK